jgi:hypothetical protein
MRGWVCRLQLLLALASAFILRSESRRTHDHILLFQIRVPSNLEARFPYLYPPGTGWPSYIPRHWVPFPSPFTTRRTMVDVIWTRLHPLEGQSAIPWHINSRWTENKTPPATVPPLFAFSTLLGPTTRLPPLSDSHGQADAGRPPPRREDGSVYFPLIRHRQHRKRRLHNSSIVVRIRCYGNVSAGLLPRNDTQGYTHRYRLMRGIYEVRRWDWLRYHDTHAKFHNDWFRHSEVDWWGGYTDAYTVRFHIRLLLLLLLLLFFFQKKESKLKI